MYEEKDILGSFYYIIFCKLFFLEYFVILKEWIYVVIILNFCEGEDKRVVVLELEEFLEKNGKGRVF